MEPPDDPGGTDPGGTNPIDEVLEVGYNVSVSNEYNDASMDTDSSVKDASQSARKRVASRRVCRQCNKKRSKTRHGRDLTDNDCNCLEELYKHSSQSVNDVTKPQSCDAHPRPDTGNIPVLMKQNQNNTPSKALSESANIPCGQPQQPLYRSETVPTSQQVYSNPARMRYQASDAAPFVVNVQRKVMSPNDNVTLHPVMFGRFLKTNSFKNIVDGSLKRIGRNRVSLSFSNFEDANSFIDSPMLDKHDYRAFIPSFNITRMGIVRGVPVEWSEEEIKENINVPFRCGPILKVRRLKRKITTNGSSELKSTETVVLTFDGQVLPKRIFICYTALPVDLYIFPTVQCYRCCRFGHVRANCRAKTPRCFKCGQNTHEGNNCLINDDDIHCCLCNGSHIATDRKCLEFARQKSIKETMAKSCLSYIEASKLHPEISKKSYADALLSTPSIPPITSIPQHTRNIPAFKQNTNISHTKTFISKSRTPASPSSKGYDVAAHKALIKDYNFPSPSNGCALELKDNLDSSVASTIEQIMILLKSLIKTNLSPSHAESLVDTTTSKYVNNGQPIQSSSVELQVCSS